MDIAALIESYVEEVFNKKINDSRVNATAVSNSFAQWEQRYMGEYAGDEFVKHSTLRQLMSQLDGFYDYHLNQSSNEVLDRIKWVTPSLNRVDNPTSGDRALIACINNLVLSGANVKPTLLTNPLDIAFDIHSNIVLGGLAYNLTDDKWYYCKSDGTVCEFLANNIATSKVVGLDAHISDYTTTKQSLTTHLGLTNAHLEPDGVTIKIVDSKLEAQVHNFSNPFTVNLETRNITFKYDLNDFELLDGALKFKRTIPDVTTLTQDVNTLKTTVSGIQQDIVTINQTLEGLGGGGSSTSTSQTFTIVDAQGTTKWIIKASGNSLAFCTPDNVVKAILSNAGKLSVVDNVEAFASIQ